MNSTVRDSPGTRSRTQVMVGTSSTSMTTTVSTARPIEAMKPSRRAGYSAEIAWTSNRVRHVWAERPVPPGPCVVKSSMPSNGRAKNVIETPMTTHRSTACLRRNVARCPLIGAATGWRGGRARRRAS